MEIFAQQIVTGVMTGGIYALLALALVLIFRSTGIINFSQGEIGTFTAFLAWSLMLKMPYAVGFVLAALIAFVIGAALERGVIRPAEGKSELNAVILTVGLFLIFNSITLSIYGGDIRTFKQPFTGPPLNIAGVTIGRYNLYLFVVVLLLSGLLYLFFQHTKLGLAMRATAANRTAAELMGIPTGRMLMLGWGLAAVMGAIAAMLVAPIVVLTPNMMFSVLVFALAAAVLGGLDSAVGAVVGGFLVGVIQNLVGTYLDDVLRVLHLGFNVQEPNQYRDVVGTALIIIVLMLRPHGLFGRGEVRRV